MIIDTDGLSSSAHAALQSIFNLHKLPCLICTLFGKRMGLNRDIVYLGVGNGSPVNSRHSVRVINNLKRTVQVEYVPSPPTADSVTMQSRARAAGLSTPWEERWEKPNTEEEVS